MAATAAPETVKASSSGRPRRGTDGGSNDEIDGCRRDLAGYRRLLREGHTTVTSTVARPVIHPKKGPGV
jgi:hypothetical protein